MPPAAPPTRDFRVELQPSPFRVVPSSVPVTGTPGTDSVDRRFFKKKDICGHLEILRVCGPGAAPRGTACRRLLLARGVPAQWDTATAATMSQRTEETTSDLCALNSDAPRRAKYKNNRSRSSIGIWCETRDQTLQSPCEHSFDCRSCSSQVRVCPVEALVHLGGIVNYAGTPIGQRPTTLKWI